MGNFTKYGIIAAIVIILGLFLGSQFITKIPEGFVGVVYSPSGGAKDEVKPAGWHVIGFFEKVTKYPIRLQTVKYKDVQTGTFDGKNITIQEISFNYQIEANKVIGAFKTFGPISIEEIEKSYLQTRLSDAARKGISKYTVIDIYGEKSSDAAVDIQTKLTDNISKLGFIVSDLTLGVPAPDAKTQEAIDARVAASQELERKNTELDIARKEAERIKVEATAAADKKRIEADATAYSNNKVQQSITPELIQMEIAKQLKDIQWPSVLGDTGSIINFPQELLKKAEAAVK